MIYTRTSQPIAARTRLRMKFSIILNYLSIIEKEWRQKVKVERAIIYLE